MAEHIYRCTSCRQYTMQEICPKCGSAAQTTRPPKYSPDDKYREMKRGIIKEEYIARGILNE